MTEEDFIKKISDYLKENSAKPSTTMKNIKQFMETKKLTFEQIHESKDPFLLYSLVIRPGLQPNCFALCNDTVANNLRYFETVRDKKHKDANIGTVFLIMLTQFGGVDGMLDPAINDKFEVWCKGLNKRILAVSRILDKLNNFHPETNFKTLLGISEKYRTCVVDDFQYDEWYEQFKKKCTVRHEKYNAVKAYKDFEKLDKPVSRENFLKFAFDVHRVALSRIRVEFLCVEGHCSDEDLKYLQDEEVSWKDSADLYHQMGNRFCSSSYRIEHFHILKKHFSDLSKLDEIPITDLIYKVLECPHPSLLIRVLDFFVGQEKYIQVLNFIPAKFRHLIRISDIYASKSKWNSMIVEEGERWIRETVIGRTSNIQKRVDNMLYEFVRFLMNLEQYFKNMDTETIIATLTADSIRNFLHYIAQMSVVRNDRVKNSLQIHNARGIVTTSLCFFKCDPIMNRMTCEREAVLNIKPECILKNVQNMREPADPSTRRTIDDEEFDAMMNLPDVSNSPKWCLIMTILREIGPRMGALLNLRYRDLLDENHIPRHVCRLIEKGNKIRDFVTSMNLKKKMISYANWYRETCEITNINHFICSHKKPFDNKPSSTSLSYHLKNFAKMADVGVNIYVHMFRHSIVSKLMSVGNSIDIVSKFIGHSCSDITEKYYWVDTVDKLSRQLKNPFTDPTIGKEEKKEYESEIISELRKRLEASIEIINIFDKNLTQAAIEDPSAKKVLNKIHESIPNLELLFKFVADSMAGFTTRSEISDQDDDCSLTN